MSTKRRDSKTVFCRMERAREKMEGICTSTLTVREIPNIYTVGDW